MPLSHRFSALCAFVFLFAAPIYADDPNNPNRLSFAAGLSWTSNDGFELEVAGIRYQRSISQRWGFEATAITDNPDDIDHSNRFLDLSATYVLWRNEDSRLLLFGGPGYLRYWDTRVFSAGPNGTGGLIVENRGDDDTATMHLGVAWEKELFKKSFLRTDIRFRRHIDTFNQFGSNSTDATISFGWRF